MAAAQGPDLAIVPYFEVTMYFRAADFMGSLIALEATITGALLHLMMDITYFVDVVAASFLPALPIAVALHYLVHNSTIFLRQIGLVAALPFQDRQPPLLNFLQFKIQFKQADDFDSLVGGHFE